MWGVLIEAVRRDKGDTTLKTLILQAVNGGIDRLV